MNLYSGIYIALLILTLVAYVVTYRKEEQHAKMIILLLVLWLLTSVAAVYLYQYAGVKNNLFIFHISTPLEFITVSLLYKNAMASAVVKKLITVAIPLFLVMSILFSAFVEKPDSNNSYMVIVQSIMLTFYSLFFLRETLLLQQVQKLQLYPMFWISFGILFYYVGILLIEGLFNYLNSRSIDLLRRAYKIEHLIKYSLFLLLIVSAFCNKIKRKSNHKVLSYHGE